MDRKDNDESPSGSSHRKKKRKHKIDSANLERKSRRADTTVRTEVVKLRQPAADIVPPFCTTDSACGRGAGSPPVPMAGDSDSTDSDCAMYQPSLLEQLKTILDNYQDAQIIRELIQNADDANASEMKIIYVNGAQGKSQGQHKQSGCYSEYFRSPALCVYNDAVFSKEDWTYIRSIYRSGKREDALKVGRFGLGFKSVFHMTDTPVIISGDQLLIIDPFRTKNKLGNDCHTLKFKKLCTSVQTKRHYKQALVAMETVFGHCGFTKGSLKDGYHGTLFWFPLRRSPSELSTKIFDQGDITDLIAMFKKEAPCLPLFLKNITHVSFFDKDEISSSFSVISVTSDKEGKAPFYMKLAACKGRPPDDDMKAIFPVEVTVENDNEVQTQRWIVCSYIKGRNNLSVELRELAEDKQLSYSPFVGIAVPVDGTSDIDFDGHAFCFLPLPSTGENYTGLPVHVNGFFALSQDRHHVKWPTDDQAVREDRAQTWNRLLCEEVIVDAYTDTLDYMKRLTVREKRTESDNLVYKILPSRTKVRPNWDTIVDPLYRSLKGKDVFYTKNNGGKWIQAKDAIFSILNWKTDGLESITLRQTEDCIVKLLLDCQRNVVNVPSHVAEFFPDVRRITPKYLRNVMKEVDIYTSRSAEHKWLLLQFVLADRQYCDLSDLQLLPIEDDTFKEFDGKYINYLCTEDELKMFPGIKQNFIKLDIPQIIQDHLTEIQKAGIFELRTLTRESFPSLLKDTLNANGKLGTNGCFDITTNHITMEWLDHIWSYIGPLYATLETFEHMFLVPVRTKSGSILELMPLKGRYVVGRCGGIPSLDKTLSNALSNLQLTVIKHIPQGETYTRLMDTYCKYPHLKGIMELLEGLYDDCKGRGQSLDTKILYFNERSNQEEKAALLNFLSKDCHRLTSQRADDIIRQLDIFPETPNVNNAVEYTSISKNRRIACRNCIPIKYHVSLLHLDFSQKILAERLGANEMSEAKLVEEILQAMANRTIGDSRSDIRQFMMYLLKNLNRLSVDQNSILYLGSRIEFIEISSALENVEVAPIRRFFDHTDSNLQELFYFDKSKFLPTKYRGKDLEPALRKFGLKLIKDVKTDDVNHVVQILDQECRQQKHKDKEKLRKCSLQVMKCLEKMATEHTGSLDSLHLKEYRWIAFLKNKPSHYPAVLPWYGDQYESLLCSPEDVFSNIHESLSASVKCIVETCHHPHLAKHFGWDNPPDAKTCLLQLEAVRNMFCIKHKATLMGIIKHIYQQMSDNMRSWAEGLTSQAVVCTGDGFHLPEEVFVSFPAKENIHLEPYMYKLPVEFSEFSSMFELLGSTAELTIRSFKTILATIKSTTRTPTSKRDRKMVIDILKCIVRLKDEDEILRDVLVPVKSNSTSLNLHPVEECTFCDKDSIWPQDNEGDSNVRYVHSDVSTELAKSLGVQSFTQRILSDGGTEEIFSACGQSESITKRLKHLLASYPDGLAVMKELVQNADDAGAQHIHFLYDERQNKDARTGLFDANMAKCQGPAMWAFNDAEFTEVDFQNIVKLGGETKKETKTKIGKFGLGFCAVYNLTDVPSFLSGRSLVIFDPHTTHLGKAIKDKSSPGLRLNFTENSSGVLKLMRNQFRPYNKIFGCDLSGDTFPPKFEGTLFRLPLRTKQQAENSDIKKTPYCRDDMVALLHLLKDCVGDLLTFTQNIKEIKVFHLSENSENPANDMQLIFSTDKAVIKTNPLFNTPADIHVMREVEKACRTKQAFTYTELISVKMYMPKNRLLSVKKSYSNSSKWLVAWASGSGKQLLENSIRLENEGALPLGSVAVSLKENRSRRTAVPFPHQEKLLGFYDTSHFFCFLPLPTECKTPVHINGCFAVSSDRKGLVKRTSDEKGETRNQIWNKMLMSDAVCNAYLLMLTSLDKFGVSLENYSILWPVISNKSDGASCLSDAFCEKVISEDCRVFLTTGGRRASFRDSVFLDNGLRHDKIVGDIAFEIFESLFQGENVPMDMSQSLFRRFCTAGCKEELGQQTMTTGTFYQEIVFPNINQLDGKKRDALVMFILNDQQHHLQQLLISNACIPVRCDDRLRLPSELVRPTSKVSSLFCDRDGRFPSEANQPFCREGILDVLVHLGMMDRTLPNEIVMERATSIANLSDSKQALHRCRQLLAYLDREQHTCRQIIDDLSSKAFIPALKKPCDWPLTWVSTSSSKGKGKFFPPNRMFFPTHMEQIACSQLIVDVEVLKSEFKVRKVLRLLGVRENVTHNDVEAQLLAISKVPCKDLTDMQKKKKLHSICLSVYEYLNNSKQQLEGQYDDLPILWLSDKMIPPKRVTLETYHGIDCTPAIYQLGTSDVTKYKHFLKCVGVQETLSKENILSALEQIKQENQSTALHMKAVHLTVNLLQLLARVCGPSGSKLNSDEKSRIYVPDDANVLRLADELCVDDGYLMKRQGYMHFVHMEVSGEINKLLDIKSKRVKHLNSIKGSMPFGQKEELVTRLKGILDGYPRDETILYELLQNADDAGSKEVMFIQDMRQHEAKEGLFGKTWSAIQGPALCVFNDSCFSVKDLEGICKLGEGSKPKDPTMTGQFGVGFNAVYHLTDAPSFITKGPTTPNQGTFCVFDPHCKFCPAADENPGLQLPDLKELEKTYPGVYECYLQKELARPKGTWFRFPLRNEEMARKSLICDKPMDGNALSVLLHQFQENMKKCLLFLRNVRKISLCEIDKQGNIKTNHSVESSLKKTDERNLEQFCHKCDTLTNALYDRSMDLQEIEMQTVKYIMTIQNHSRQPEHWIIAQTFGVDSNTEVPDSVSTAVQCGDIALTPKGAVALPCISRDCGMEVSTDNEHDASRHFSKSRGRRGVTQSSSAGSINSNVKSKHEGQAFCFLPLPLKTGLPVHVNGHFALTQTRGSMWEKSHRGDWNRWLFETAISNSYVLAIEYLRDTFLGNGGDTNKLTMVDIKCSLEKYHDAFPRYEEGKTVLIKVMIASFFSTLYEKESTVFPVLSPTATPIWWVALQQTNHTFPAYFDNFLDQFQHLAQSNKTGKLHHFGYQIQHDKEKEENEKRTAIQAHQLSNILKDIGMKLLESPLWIHDSMLQALQEADNASIDQDLSEKHLVNPSSVIQFLRIGRTLPDACLINCVECEVTDTPVKSIENVECLLRYCLKDSNNFEQHMEQLPILVTNDAILRCFSSTQPVFVSRFCDLLPKSAEDFVHSNIVKLLQFIELKSCLSLKYLDLNSFAQMLPHSFDKAILSGQKPIVWDKQIFSEQWIHNLWQYLDTFEDIDFQAFGNWCLIPGELKTTTRTTHQLLVPCDKGFVLFDNRSFEEDYLRHAIASLNIPTPLLGTYSKTLRCVVASQQDPVRLVQCLHYHKDNLKDLETSQCRAILQHIAQPENTKKLRGQPSVLDKIKDLPLFTTVNGNNVKLLTHLNYYIVIEHRDLIKEGIESWSNKCRYILLAENNFTLELMSLLNCNRTISVPELYCKHILPHFYHLEREHHLTHLEYVRYMLKDISECPFKKALRTSEFIYHEGSLKRADCFYSPRNRLCKKLCDQSMLPPDPFGYEEWNTLMLCAGMKETVSADLFFHFAKQVENSAQTAGMTKEIKEKSKAIVTYLFDTEALCNNVALLESIRNIRFVEPYCVQPVYEEIYPQFGCKGLIMFCGSVPQSLTQLVWTTTSVLPVLPWYVHKLQMKNGLGILQKPALRDVLSHTHNVCDSINKRLREKKTKNKCPSESILNKLMTTIYTYLQEHCVGNPETKRMLLETPVVHMREEELYVTARQVSISFGGKESIPPYLFEIPLHYGPYKQLFQFLGTTDSVTLSQYSEVLNRIQAEVKSNMLGPDQISDVVTALRSVMMLLEEKTSTDIEESMTEVETLYLPTSDKCLAKSTDMVFADKAKLKTRIMRADDHGILFMHSLNDCHKQEDLILRLPDHVKPRVLSSIIQEHLISSSNTKQDTKVDQLGAFLASSRFLKAMQMIGKFSNDVFDSYRQRLMCIQLVSLPEITTILTVDGRQIPDTVAPQECFQSNENGEQKLYFLANNDEVRPWLKDIGQELFGTLSDCLDNKIAPEKIRELVDYMDDPTRFKKYCEELFDEKENEDDESLSYFPGKLVPLRLHGLLENDITLLKIGDLVAYEMFDPVIEGGANDVTADIVYVFVRIMKMVPLAIPNNSLLQKYEVNFGQDVNKEVMGLRLYKVVYPETSSTTEVVLHQFGHDGATPLNRDHVFDEIIVTLSDAWKLDSSDRKRVVKRLLLIWHPDKNLCKGETYQTFCKDVTQFIFDIIRRLDKGEQFGNDHSNSTDGGKRERKEKRNYDGWSYGKKSKEWQAFGDQVSSTGRANHKHTSDSYARRGTYVPNPQHAEAKRWLRQASRDFQCGMNSVELNKSTTECDDPEKGDYNWICFKFHQACEKACKAYTYKIDEKKVTHSHNLLSIIPPGPGNEQLVTWLQEIETLVGSYSRMRYPDVLDYPNIPGTSYTKKQANRMMELTGQVMEEIENKL